MAEKLDPKVVEPAVADFGELTAQLAVEIRELVQKRAPNLGYVTIMVDVANPHDQAIVGNVNKPGTIKLLRDFADEIEQLEGEGFQDNPQVAPPKGERH